MRMRLALLCFSLASLSSAYAETSPHWLEVRSDHFIVVSDSSDKQARHIAAEFERMRSLFHTLLPKAASDSATPIVVLALKDKKSFTAFEPAAYLGKGKLDLAGYFLRTPGSNYILVRLDSQGEHPFATVYHEYTHFVMRKAEWMPLWLSEGLAEFYQNTDIEEKDVRLGQPSPDDIYYLRQNKLLPLTTLLTVDHASPYYHDEQKGSAFYAESWALTHYIEVNDFKLKLHRMQDYAQLLTQHEDPVTAAQHAFGDLGKLQEALNSYIGQGSFTYFKVNSAYTVDEATLHSIPVSLEDADALRADVLAYNERLDEAKALDESILGTDPKNALAHETMGSLCYLRHDIRCAKKWFAEAVQLDSHSFFAHYNYAVMSMQDGDQGHDDAIEASLKTSIQLEPNFAPSYDALAHFYAMHHEKLDEAHMANLHAIALEPEELNYRLNAVSVLMEQNNPTSALSVLSTAKAIFNSPTEQAIIDGRIQDIERYREQVKAAEENKARMDRSGSATVSERSPEQPDEPPYPSGPPTGPHHTVAGTLQSVACSYPTTLTLQVAQPKGKTVPLYSNNYMKIVFSTSNYVLKDTLDVCKSIEGMKARVVYGDVTDKRVVGQIIAVELSK